MANEVEIIVEPVEPSGLPVERLREWLAGDRGLQEVLGDVDVESLLMSEPEILQRERKDNSPFIATVFDPQQNRAVEVSGFMDQPENLRIKPSSYRPLPTRDELSNAWTSCGQTVGMPREGVPTNLSSISRCRRWLIGSRMMARWSAGQRWVSSVRQEVRGIRLWQRIWERGPSTGGWLDWISQPTATARATCQSVWRASPIRVDTTRSTYG